MHNALTCSIAVDDIGKLIRHKIYPAPKHPDSAHNKGTARESTPNAVCRLVLSPILTCWPLSKAILVYTFRRPCFPLAEKAEAAGKASAEEGGKTSVEAGDKTSTVEGDKASAEAGGKASAEEADTRAVT